MTTRAVVHRMLVCVSCLASVSACSTGEPLVSTVSPAGGASTETSDGAPSDPLESSDDAELATEPRSLAECVEGAWSIDKESYLQMVGSGLGALGEGLTVTGDATVTFSGDSVVSSYEGWTVSGSNADGDITVVLEGTETAQWEIDEAGMLTTRDVQTTVESVLTVSAGGQQMVLPMASEDQPGVDLAGLATACEADTMTLTGPEGYLVMYRQ